MVFVPHSVNIIRKTRHLSRLRRESVAWCKHGYLNLVAPDLEPVVDITICMEVLLLNTDRLYRK